MRKIYFILMLPLIVPHLICYRFSKNRWKIDADVERYEGVVKKMDCKVLRLAYLLVFQKEFRNLFYYRLGRWSILLRYLPKLSTLYINVPGGKIGEGLVIQHGFSTIITAESIGKNCWINQQVTIGYNDSKTYGYGKPVIGDNVRISAGAKVVGPITIGHNSTVGCNAVVSKDLPENTVVVPSAMRIIRENGKRTSKTF